MSVLLVASGETASEISRRFAISSDAVVQLVAVACFRTTHPDVAHGLLNWLRTELERRHQVAELKRTQLLAKADSEVVNLAGMGYTNERYWLQFFDGARVSKIRPATNATRDEIQAQIAKIEDLLKQLASKLSAPLGAVSRLFAEWIRKQSFNVAELRRTLRGLILPPSLSFEEDLQDIIDRGFFSVLEEVVASGDDTYTERLFDLAFRSMGVASKEDRDRLAGRAMKDARDQLISEQQTVVSVPTSLLIHDVSSHEQSTQVSRPLPKRAPAKYAKRHRDPELAELNIIDFLRVVYGDWLNGALTRVALARLDPSAATAVANWLRNKQLPPDIRLPTKKELNDRDLALTRDPRDLTRLAAAARRRHPKPS